VVSIYGRKNGALADTHLTVATSATIRRLAMSVKFGLLALLDAKPGKGAELGAFLEKGRALAAAEVGTVTWYAFRLSDTQYGIFDSFETEEGRQAHLNGEIPTALGQVAPDLLAREPDIRVVDVIAQK
jgi:quinol monooxygenase YgiN